MKKLYIETYGCQMNVADSEVVASVMQMAGYEVTDNASEADAVFLNTCSVRENAENKIYHRLDALHAENLRTHHRILGVLGCMAERVRNDLIENHHADIVAGPDAYLHLPDLTAQGMGPMSITLNNTIMPMGGVFHTPTLTVGLFHQSTVEILKNLYLTAGIRLDYEHYKMSYDAPSSVDFDFAMPAHGMNVELNDMNVTPTFRGKTSNHNWHVLPKASLKYDFGKTGNIYASVGRGYRSGGYNVQLFSDLLQTEMRREMMSAIDAGTEAYLTNLFSRIPSMPPGHVDMIMGRMRAGMPNIPEPNVAETTYYKPETAWNYELGTHLSFLDGRLKADLAAFWIETRDLQISQMAESGMGRVTINAGKSRSRGIEASLWAAVTDALTVNASYGFTHAMATLQDADGNDLRVRVPFAPRHTASFATSYTWHTRGWLQDITLAAIGKGMGRIYWTRENDISQPFYALLDARLTLRHSDLELSLWGNNLTSTHYNAFSFVTRGQVCAQQGTPTQIGADIRIKF